MKILIQIVIEKWPILSKQMVLANECTLLHAYEYKLQVMEGSDKILHVPYTAYINSTL